MNPLFNALGVGQMPGAMGQFQNMVRMRLTPEKINLFLSAAQELITQTQVQDDLCKYL